MYLALGRIFHTHPFFSHAIDALIYGLFVATISFLFPSKKKKSTRTLPRSAGP